jgi:hypothetical protein
MVSIEEPRGRLTAHFAEIFGFETREIAVDAFRHDCIVGGK